MSYPALLIYMTELYSAYEMVMIVGITWWAVAIR